MRPSGRFFASKAEFSDKMTPMRDYDGFISQWNNFGILPDNIEEFAQLILANTTGDITEVGGGNGLLSARLAKERNVQMVDQIYPMAQGDFDFVRMDARSSEFMDLVKLESNLVGRRSFCLLLSNEWMDQFETTTSVSTIISQALDSEKGHVFRNAEVEALFLERRGWKVEIHDEHYVIAIRG